MRLTRLRILASGLVGFGLATGGFLAGRHLGHRRFFGHPVHYLGYKGNAQEHVRADVLASIEAFQSGYTQRDPAIIPVFMGRLFPKDQDILFLGSEPGEWTEGYPQVGEFIANDWRHYGDVRLDLNDAMISTSNNVAWVTTVGTVANGSLARPIRFAAVLTRSDTRWLFRLIQFQWDERPPRLGETPGH